MRPMYINVVKFPVKDFHLDHIFDCGQCFRWNRNEDGSWSGIAGGRVARMSMEPVSSETEGILQIESSGDCMEESGQFWREYLDLGRDYGKIKESLRQKDPAMEQVIAAGEGIRILKQDLWETMVSFIISQNNNIPRIKGCIEALAKNFGEPVFGGQEYFHIPQPEVLAALTREDLSACRLGYRGPYLIETARQVLEMGGMGALEEKLALRKAEAGPEAVSEVLQGFSGVGPKVAACIALFGVQSFGAFPIDVWMRRVMNQVYGIGEKNIKEMEEHARKYFAGYEGFAQQYLFYYVRGLQ